jgi:hypothetical protein
MPPSVIREQLRILGHKLNRWSAELRLAAGLAVLLVVLDGLALSDILFQYGFTGRLVAWGVLVLLAGVLAWILVRVLWRRPVPEAVAVCVEQAFPQLDNHLINFLLFASSGRSNPFTEEYLKRDIPHWSGLDFRLMRDRRRLRRAQAALAGALLLSLIPWLPAGRAWPVAVWRIVNPFSAVAPASLTRILCVTPGEVSVPQGANVTVACQVGGREGHAVWLDVFPADGLKKTYGLGLLKGRGVEGFSNTLFKVSSTTRYRFRAGDAFAPDWYCISPRPPLAFASVLLKVVPPPYMAVAPRKYDAQAANIDIPEGSAVAFAVKCNAPVRTVTLSGPGQSAAQFRTGEAGNWEATCIVTNGSTFTLAAVGVNGEKSETTIGYHVSPDTPPVLTLKYPRQRVDLMPGSAPAIEFKVTDDYGLDEVAIEQSSGEEDAAAPKVLKSYKWVTSRSREFSTLWRGDIRKAAGSGTLTLRVVARDIHPGSRQVTVSPALVFTLDPASVAAEKQAERAQKTKTDLNHALAVQRENIDRTRELQRTLAATTAEQWGAVAARQETVREIIRQLLEKGGGLGLGNLLVPVRKLYAAELSGVIPLLRGVPSLRDEGDRPKQAARALSMEEKILRQLTFAEEGARRAGVAGRNSGLTGLLDGIMARQDKVIRTTSQCASQGVAVASTVIDEQDGLGSDVTGFITMCRADAEALKGDDGDYAAFLGSVAVSCEEGKITSDMLRAAEKLEKNALREALPHEQEALRKVAAERRKFDEMKARGEREQNEEMIGALETAKVKLDKLMALEKKLNAEMDAVEAQRDKSGKPADTMEADFAEIRGNLKEAMLQIPRDLDVFAHLNVGNDMVEDIHSVFEEVTQKQDSEKADESEVKEKAVAKREYLADDMEKVKQRIDDCESWLKKIPDNQKVTVESADKQEMPEGVALTPLQTEAEDIIGDLLKEDKKKQDLDNDGAINAAMPDMEMGGDITEGDTTTFSAKGKSGNETPDHKEQDGRSKVGRQGMSIGEAAAGSGTIGKGDKDMEARRTQDPTQSGQVKADGQADTKATGGGKLGSGKADGMGMGGGKTRMDSTEAGSPEDFMSLMAKRADGAYIQASMKGLRADSLKSAAHHIRQAADAISKGAPIGQVAGLRRKAVADLKIAKTELGRESSVALDGRASTSMLDDIMEESPDEAPPQYRDLVSEYYMKLNESL